MFYKKTRDIQYLADLKFFLEDRYGFAIREIAEAKRGFYGETWKVITDSDRYFIKIIYDALQMARYACSFEIIDHMFHHGIDFISRIIKTKQGGFYCLFHGGALGVFAFVEGENTEEYELSRLIRHLAVIYRLQTGNLSVPTETFDTSCIDRLFQHIQVLKSSRSQLAAEIAGVLEDNLGKLHHHAAQLPYLAGLCAKDNHGYHITSGDAGGNVILDGDQFTIIDWDDIVLAPIERDLWFYMQDEGWMEEIHETLAASGIAYRLQQDRLAFYCIRGFFHYLCEYLRCFLDSDEEEMKKDIADAVREYMGEDFFINACLKRADGFCSGLIDLEESNRAVEPAMTDGTILTIDPASANG
jgi:hypothetical protein